MSTEILQIQIAPLPSNFRGTPQQLAEAIASRLSVVAETSTPVVSALPTENRGPVVFDGFWYLWNDDRATYEIQAGYVPDASITNSKMADASIKTANLLEAAVTTPKIADTSVTTAKLAPDSVTAEKLADNAVTAANLEGDSVTPAKVALDTPSLDGSGSVTIDWSAGWFHRVPSQGNTSGSVTLSFSHARPGQQVTIAVACGGSYSVGFPAGIKWRGGVAPTLSDTSGKVDLISVLYDGTNYYGAAALAFA